MYFDNAKERQIYSIMFKHFCLIVVRRKKIENFWKFFFIISLCNFLQKDIQLCICILFTFIDRKIVEEIFVKRKSQLVRRLLCEILSISYMRVISGNNKNPNFG